MVEKKYEIRYLAVAQSDLVDIVQYISEQLHAPEAAIHLVDKFDKKMKSCLSRTFMEKKTHRYKIENENHYR